MDIAALSMVMSQSRVQEAASVSVMKMAMNRVKESGIKMTEMMQSTIVEPNLGNNLDVRV